MLVSFFVAALAVLLASGVASFLAGRRATLASRIGAWGSSKFHQANNPGSAPVRRRCMFA